MILQRNEKKEMSILPIITYIWFYNITINKKSTCNHKMDVVSDEAVDKYSKVNDVNTSNCESVKVQLQDSVGSSTCLLYTSRCV